MKRARFFEKVRDKIAHTFNFDAYRNGLRHQYENKIFDEYGMSLDEYFAVHPEAKTEYDQLGLSKLDLKWNNLKDSVKKTIEDFESNPHVQAAIENFTGERDTAENERNRSFQSDEAAIARSWEEEQAKAAREWDSIGAQMERAVGAGVNPISIAMQNGGINSSATTSIPSAPGIPAGSASLMHSGLPDLAATVFNGISTFAEQRLKQTQADDIVAMRQYNIAEKQANTAYLQSLNESVGLSNVAQEITNRWSEKMNQINYINAQLESGVKRSTIFEKYSIAKLNGQQIASVQQSMRLDLERFNQTLPLEVQLMESELDLKKKTAQDVYEEICLRHLQQIEQQNRNKQSGAEAESAQTAADLAKATYEDAISAFHNDMVKGAAEAGVSLNDYMYYGCNPGSLANIPGRIVYSLERNKALRKGWNLFVGANQNIRGLDLE